MKTPLKFGFPGFPVHKSRWLASAKALYVREGDRGEADDVTGPEYAVDNIVQSDWTYTFHGPSYSILGEWLQVHVYIFFL